MRKFICGLVALAVTSIFVSELNACPPQLRRSVVRERVVREPIRRERVVIREKVVREPAYRERIVRERVINNCPDCVQEFRVERFRSSY